MSSLVSLFALTLCACGGVEEEALPEAGDVQKAQQAEASGESATLHDFHFVDTFTGASINGVTVGAAMTNDSPPEYSVDQILATAPSDGIWTVFIRCILGGASDYYCTKWPKFQLWANHPSYGPIYKPAYNSANHKELTWPVRVSFMEIKMTPVCVDASPCHGYRCNLTTHLCRTSCSATIKCAPGYQCVNGDCV